MSGDLCEELIFEIFTRLLPKSLLRFRSLSKSLCSCIDSRHFIHMHTSRSPQKVLLDFSYHKGAEYHRIYNLYSEDQLASCPRREDIDITAIEFPYSKFTCYAGSCNGILCLFDREKYSITLWNPSIRRELTLPNSPTSRCPGCDCEYNRVGFGFDSVSDDYKIVSLPKKGGTRKRSYVYTMKTGAWCKIASPTPCYRKVTLGGYYVNGVLHWVVCRPHIEDYYIMTFNLSTYVFGVIELPEPSWESQQLTTIEGSLAAISFGGGDNWIWVMREYNNTASWSVFSKSKANQVGGRLFSVLQLTSNGNYLLLAASLSLHVYDAKIGTLSRLRNFGNYHFIGRMIPCVESLQLLDIETPCQGSQLDTGEQKPNQSKKKRNKPKPKILDTATKSDDAVFKLKKASKVGAMRFYPRTDPQKHS